jgi:coproporphyrinogen III oxidase-like Fe-S oxidoreductase
MHASTLEHMARAGYTQHIVDWFFRDNKFFHSYQQHNWQRTDAITLLGIGASAYSYVDGLQYYNVNDIGEYCRRVNEHRLPIERGEDLPTVEEQMRRALMLGLKFVIDRVEWRNLYGCDVVNTFFDEMALLRKLHLISINDSFVQLTDNGSLFADEIGQLFYSATIRHRMNLVQPTRRSTTLPHINPFQRTA